MIYIDDGNTIQMSQEEYYRMEEQITWLNCLEQAGVDNWEGISYAHDLFKEQTE